MLPRCLSGGFQSSPVQILFCNKSLAMAQDTVQGKQAAQVQRVARSGRVGPHYGDRLKRLLRPDGHVLSMTSGASAWNGPLHPTQGCRREFADFHHDTSLWVCLRGHRATKAGRKEATTAGNGSHGTNKRRQEMECYGARLASKSQPGVCNERWAFEEAISGARISRYTYVFSEVSR